MPTTTSSSISGIIGRKTMPMKKKKRGGSKPKPKPTRGGTRRK